VDSSRFTIGGPSACGSLPSHCVPLFLPGGVGNPGSCDWVSSRSWAIAASQSLRPDSAPR